MNPSCRRPFMECMRTMLLGLALLADTSGPRFRDAFRADLLERVDRVRRHGKEDPEAACRRVFGDWDVAYVHLAATYLVAGRLETADEEEFEQFKGLGRLGGKRDALTPEVAGALDRNGGAVFLDWEGVAPTGPCLLFTMSGRARWESYMVVRFWSPPVRGARTP